MKNGMEKETYMEEKTIKEMIETLRNYELNGEKPIVVVGPDASTENKLRIYAYGGLIGRIPMHGKQKVELLSKDYLKYLENTDWDEPEFISGKDDKNLVLTSDEYLKTSLTAALNWSASHQERKVETEIVNLYMKHSAKWCVVDMEFRPKAEWGIGDGKPDIIVFDGERGELGLIELKYQNKNCDNMFKHYTDFEMVLNHSINFNKEMLRRICFLSKYDLIDKSFKSDICNALGTEQSPKNTPVWFGFLFVDGSKAGAQKVIQSKLIPNIEENIPIDECRFQYVDTVGDLAQNGLCFSQMQSYEDFMK